MKIQQTKKSNKHTFTFYEDHFNFAYKNKSGSGDADLNYANFPQKSSVQIEENQWLRSVGYLWMAVGLYVLGHAIITGTSLSGKGFWMLMGVGCVIWAHFSKVRYSVFTSNRGSIFVIQDRKHDKILNEINRRRKEQLSNWYGEVDPNNELEIEIGKFRWLAEQGAISKEESEKKIAQVELIHKKDNLESPDQIIN